MIPTLWQENTHSVGDHSMVWGMLKCCTWREESRSHCHKEWERLREGIARMGLVQLRPNMKKAKTGRP